MSYGQELNIDGAMVMKPVSATLNGNKVYSVFWVYMVSWVIKLKKLNELKKLKKLFGRNEPRYRNRDRETMTNWRGN